MTRGTLRVYLGAAPGVGKTFAMLNEGRRRASRGTEVVVGLVETHGRALTQAQIADLEVIPRATLSNRGAEFEEMDVDAIIARRPDVALIDEFAHANIPGSKHEKRWQDVKDILAAGIDVITTGPPGPRSARGAPGEDGCHIFRPVYGPASSCCLRFPLGERRRVPFPAPSGIVQQLLQISDPFRLNLHQLVSLAQYRTSSSLAGRRILASGSVVSRNAAFYTTTSIKWCTPLNEYRPT